MTGDLSQRAAQLRELLAPRAPDPYLVDLVDRARRQLDAEYARERDWQEGIGRGWSIDGENRRAATRGATWEHRSACPDCFAFRAPASAACKRCGSTARPIPAHERASATSGTKRRANARRASKRKRK